MASAVTAQVILEVEEHSRLSTREEGFLAMTLVVKKIIHAALGVFLNRKVSEV